MNSEILSFQDQPWALRRRASLTVALGLSWPADEMLGRLPIKTRRKLEAEEEERRQEGNEQGESGTASIRWPSCRTV